MSVAYAVASAAAVACWSQLLAMAAVPRMEDERAFWRSDFAARWLQVYHSVFAVVMLASNAFVLKKIVAIWTWAAFVGMLMHRGAAAIGFETTAAGGGGGSGSNSTGPDTAPSAQQELEMGLGIHVGVAVVYVALAVWQLVMVRTWPGAYRRVRLPWMLFGRALRVATTVINAVTNRGAVWAGIMQDVHAIAADSPVKAALNLILAWGGALLGMLHNLNLFLPVRWAALFQLFTTATLVYSHSGLIASALHHPALRPGYSTLCSGLAAWQAVLHLPRPRAGHAAASAARSATAAAAGTATDGPWQAHDWCVQHPQAVVVLCMVALGAMLPLALIAALERLMKVQYVQLMAAETDAAAEPRQRRAVDAAAAGGLVQADLDLDQAGEDLDLDPALEGALDPAVEAHLGLRGALWELVCIAALMLLTSLIDWLTMWRSPDD